MKAPIGVNSQSTLTHSAAASAANVHDKHALPHLLHWAETRVWGDSAYQSQGELIRAKAQRAKDFTKERYRGLRKNAHRLFVPCALANWFIGRRYLLRLQGAWSVRRAGNPALRPARNQ